MKTFEVESLVPRGRAFAMHYIGVESAWSFPEHRHRGFSELTYVLRGEVEQRIDGRVIRLRAGEALLARERERHALGGTSFLYCNINITSATWRSLGAF